jgi:hypothetical protein
LEKEKQENTLAASATLAATTLSEQSLLQKS